MDRTVCNCCAGPDEFCNNKTAMEKPTVEQVAWIFEEINKNAGGSFRKLIYDHLGFGPNAYSELFSAGGQNITNAMHFSVDPAPPEYSGDYLDSLIAQNEALRSVYEAAKILRGAYYFGKQENIFTATAALRKAVDIAAREIEDSNG